MVPQCGTCDGVTLLGEKPPPALQVAIICLLQTQHIHCIPFLPELLHSGQYLIYVPLLNQTTFIVELFL